MSRVLLVLLIACSGSKSTAPSNTSKAGSGDAKAVAGASDCMNGGVEATTTKSATCGFWGDVPGTPNADGKIPIVRCCYATAEAACKNTGGCDVKDCNFDDKAAAPSQVMCRDTTHGGIGPTNP